MKICYMYAIYSTGHQQSSEVYRSSRTIDQKSVMNCPDRKFIPKTQQFLFSLFWPFRLYKVLGKLARYYLLATIDMEQVLSYHRHCFPVLVHEGSWWWMRVMANLGHFHKFWNFAFVLPFKFRKKWLLLFLTVWSIATQFRLKFSDSITKINFPHRFVDTDFLAGNIQATAPHSPKIMLSSLFVGCLAKHLPLYFFCDHSLVLTLDLRGAESQQWSPLKLIAQ